MIIDLDEEEWEFLQRMVTRAIALTEKGCIAKERDYIKAKELLEKFIKGKKG